MVAALVIPAAALAHIERASYWPDPGADKSVKPAAGGKVPKARSLASALKTKPKGETRVVCKKGSLKRLRKSVRRARKHGYDIRPTDHRKLSRKRARKLKRINRRLKERCQFHQIQPAVTASGNNDRVVIMPGLYTEPRTRAKPTDDPACDQYEITNDEDQAGAVSYRYQVHCPNDQNLITLLGRKPGDNVPQPPLDDRHGIPDLGRCIRCNVQIEGSGVSAGDVVIDAGRVKSGNGAPIGAKKDVGIRADRADGFVLRNLTVRHAREHGIYVLETEGYRLERFKVFFAAEYGLLTFVGDHGLIQDCEAVGAGDAGLYPGSAADTGDEHLPGDGPRYNTELRRCDMHHNAIGYSGTASNAVHIHHNEFYDNGLGFSTDTLTASGHPGFPQDSDLIENNDIYSNNFNVFAPESDVEPLLPVPQGTGFWILGGNHNIVRNNRIWDNWRRGAMLISIPDSYVCAPPAHQHGCDPAEVSTSFNNEFYGNVMGVAPDGSAAPNGVDFWWDELPGPSGNCWHDNGSTTNDPDPLPTACGDPNNTGSGDAAKEAELHGCLAAYLAANFDPTICPYITPPPKPGSAEARQATADEPELRQAQLEYFADFCEDNGEAATCRPFAGRLGN